MTSVYDLWNRFLIAINIKMRALFVFLLLNGVSTLAFSQRARQFMIAVHSDLIKSDNDGFFEKMQGGAEGAFYLSRKFAATSAIEWWTGDKIIVIPGVRFCPIDEAFVRIRALIKEDLSIGGGFAKPLSDRWRIEAVADFYFEGQMAIRAGVAYGFGKHP